MTALIAGFGFCFIVYALLIRFDTCADPYEQSEPEEKREEQAA